jgi:hypothetical protein
MEEMEKKFDIEKRRTDNKDFDFIQQEGKNFLLSINKFVKDFDPTQQVASQLLTKSHSGSQIDVREELK